MIDEDIREDPWHRNFNETRANFCSTLRDFFRHVTQRETESCLQKFEEIVDRLQIDSLWRISSQNICFLL